MKGSRGSLVMHLCRCAVVMLVSYQLFETNDGSDVIKRIMFPQGESSIPEKKTRTTNRTVHWLDYEHKQIVEDSGDYYSGSWLTPMSHFLSMNAKGMENLESASHTVWDKKEYVRMAVDWLDFSVEHMSRWYKDTDLLQERHNDIAINTIADNLIEYVQDTSVRARDLEIESGANGTLLHPTIAVISSFAMSSSSNSSEEIWRSATLTRTTLGAVISSLIRVGVGRIVCSVVDEKDEISVNETFAWLAELYENSTNSRLATELSYVRVDQELYNSKYVSVNRPRAMFYGLQQALKNAFNASYTIQWLGNKHPPSYWKYVYFSEADLVLQTRASSLPAIHESLEQGLILMPHRLELVRHESDFVRDNETYNGTKDFLPNRGIFSNILELDGDVDMCCDDGINRPSFNNMLFEHDNPQQELELKCTSWWWNCGYTQGWETLGIPDEVLHRRILKFTPFIRLTQGTRIISISGTEHQRKCNPRKRRMPNEICERPSPSGRSYSTSEELGRNFNSSNATTRLRGNF